MAEMDVAKVNIDILGDGGKSGQFQTALISIHFTDSKKWKAWLAWVGPELRTLVRSAGDSQDLH